MSNLAIVAAMYESFDLHLQSLHYDLWKAASDPHEDFSTHDQRIKDQAYFVLANGQESTPTYSKCLHGNDLCVTRDSTNPQRVPLTRCDQLSLGDGFTC